MKKYRQRGKNDNYPGYIEVWYYNENPTPDWIIDRCKVNFIDEKGNITLETKNMSGGGICFIESGSYNTLFSIKSKEDCICFDGSKIFILTRKQLNLLYKEED